MLSPTAYVLLRALPSGSAAAASACGGTGTPRAQSM
jgi:hypothetical protein